MTHFNYFYLINRFCSHTCNVSKMLVVQHHLRSLTKPSKVNIFNRVHATLYVGRSVGQSVRWSVGPSVITSRFGGFRAKRRADFSYCPCPATILPLPTRTRLMLPCIRPCYFKGLIKEGEVLLLCLFLLS